MLLHYLKITLRGLLKDRVFSIINILGISVAIACSFLLLFWIKFETDFESCYPAKERIYKLLIEEERTDGLHYQGVMKDCSSQLKESFPQIEGAANFCNQRTSVCLEGSEGDGLWSNWADADFDYIRMFALEYLEGDPMSVYKNRGGVIISDNMARRLFGGNMAKGKIIQRYNDFFKVEAVVKLPANSNLQFDVLSLNNKVFDPGMQLIMLKEKEKMTPELVEKISRLLNNGITAGKKIIVQRLEDVHLHTPDEIKGKHSFGISLKYGDAAQILYFSVAVLLILSMAVINYVNTSIARAINRMKEVGVRKVSGANKKQLIERFFFESFIFTAAGVIVSFVFTKYIFPDFSEIMGNKITLQFDWQVLTIAFGVTIFVSALSGGYAAFYLSSVKPVIILRGGAVGGSKDRLRRWLLGIQFFLSIGILICTLFIYKQISAIFNESTGMERSNIIILDCSLWYDSGAFIKVIKQENHNIIDATMANCPPYNVPWSFAENKYVGYDNFLNNINLTCVYCDNHYANTFGLKLIMGEFLQPDIPWFGMPDPENKARNMIVNESFVKLMNVENPLGMTVGGRKIIGVVKDFNFKPLKEKISPFMMYYNPENMMYMYIKTTGQDKQATLNFIIRKYKEMKPKHARQPVVYRTVEDEYNKMYAEEIRTANILSLFSIISLFLSLMGVFSMVSFMIEKRSKEIAIRRISGARTFDIVMLFWREIVRTATFASLFVIPVCYILMHNWLEEYIYRTSLSWWIFLSVPGLLIILVCLIVGLQVVYTARKRPVESLRSE